MSVGPKGKGERGKEDAVQRNESERKEVFIVERE